MLYKGASNEQSPVAGFALPGRILIPCLAALAIACCTIMLGNPPNAKDGISANIKEFEFSFFLFLRLLLLGILITAKKCSKLKTVYHPNNVTSTDTATADCVPLQFGRYQHS